MTTLSIAEAQLQGFATEYSSWMQAYFALQKSLIDAGKLVEVGSIASESIHDDVKTSLIDAKNTAKEDFINF